MTDAFSSSASAASPSATSSSSTPFVTTSDVLSSLNKALNNLETPQDIAKPHFELQRRMPDGSTRRATETEVQAADMETKLSQAAAHVQTLPTWEAKLEWAQKQRQYGNTLYQQERYAEAIDIYLTCLVVAQEEEKTPNSEGLLFFYLMNNLAQAALQLKWYSKAEHFCSLAFEHEENRHNWTIESTTRNQRQQMAKLYHKRSKARRLKGLYKEARLDLEAALEWLDYGNGKDDDTMSASRRAIQREVQLVAQGSAEAKRNKERAKKGMQKVLQSTDHESDDDASNEPLFAPTERTFSTLRAPSRVEDDHDEEDDTTSPTLSYWQCYLAMVARVAEKLLEWTGDDEYSSSRQEEQPKED